MKLVLLNFLSLRKAVILGFDTDWYIDIFIFCLQNCSDPLWENNVQVSQTYYITRTILISIGENSWDLQMFRIS